MALRIVATLLALLSLSGQTVGEQRTLVLLVNFQDNTSQPLTVAQAESLVFGTVNGFYVENSSSQAWLSGNAHGWFTVPLSGSGTCNAFEAGSAADSQAESQGINVASYNRIIYYFNSINCGWNGLADRAGVRSYINGLTPSSVLAKTIAHEMGHSFGLYHSHSLSCEIPPGTKCTAVEYGDTYDTMGNPDFGHFNAAQKEILGWLVVPEIAVSGDYTIGAFEAGAYPRAIKVRTQNGYYYIEYRQAVGFDSFLGSRSGNVTAGIAVHYVTGPNGIYLLNLSHTQNWFDPALDFGASYSDPCVAINPLTGNGQTATVRLTVQGCEPPTPPNAAPVAQDDASSTTKNVAVSIPALANDSDPDGQPISVISASNGSLGKVTVNANGTVTYKPNKNALGTDHFTYTITDGQLTDTASVTVTINRR